MKSTYNLFAALIFAVMATFVSSCSDDFTPNSSISGNLEGDCMVNFNLDGMPLESALTRTPGDAIDHLGELYVLFYKADDANSETGELAYAFTTDAYCENDVFDSSLSASYSDNNQKISTSKILVPRGYYRVYAVSNVKGFSQKDFSRESISTPEKLRNYNLLWNGADIKENNAMFGFFTDSSASGYEAIKEKAPLLTLGSESITLHAWLKRSVSKVTVAFDGTGLYDNVNVYIKKVTIKDIPLGNKLGASNTPTNLDSLIVNGEQIVYSNDKGASLNTRISSREPYFPGFTGTTDDKTAVEKWRETVHSESANSLYFFENCQGFASGNPDENGSWKQQTDTNGNNIPDDRDNNVLKDTKIYGSYVEVEAYYKNDRFGSQTEGNIIYRFMLGKNITDDFNAERNYHYKLTLCLKNNANDVDWHIDYSDQPGVYIPSKIYVSYTYNTPSILPIRIVGSDVTDVNVEILSSNWYPDDSTIPFFKGSVEPGGLATGFLSLSYDERARVRDGEATNNTDIARVASYWTNGNPNNQKRTYINSNGQKVTYNDLNEFGYQVNTRVTSENMKVFEADIPMFTRPLVIYKWAGWTGANPYYSSTRNAKVLLSWKVDGKADSKVVDVEQVRRIENPAGIYRRHNNADPFDVTLMERNGEGGDHNKPISYQAFKSDGAWRATIYMTSSESGNQTDAWFSVTAGSQKISKKGEYIQGDDNSDISFTYKPNGTISQNQTRNGIIKVEYNNYTCTHYIFVRQGYAPMRIDDSTNLYWHTFNLYSGVEEANHPCEGGSLFLRGNLAPAILDTNTAGLGQSVSSFQVISDNNGTTITNQSLTSLKNVTRKDFAAGNLTLSKNNNAYNPWKSGRVPKPSEWGKLINAVNSQNLLDRAFGVLYADGAVATQTSPENVYQCRHSDVTTGSTPKGMRGVFVYNNTDGRNLFLPIGALGYGRRKIGLATTTSANGETQYGFGDSYSNLILQQAGRAPLNELYSNEGAIYWAQLMEGSSAASNYKDTNSWDINYKTYDFDYMDEKENRYSACHIRLVQDTAP